MSRPNRRSRLLLVSAVLVVGAWLLGGLHRVPGDGAVHLKVWVTGAVRPAAPGLTFTPPLLARLIRFPGGIIDVPVRLRGLRSAEGAEVLAAGTLRVRAVETNAAALAATFPSGWTGSSAAQLSARLRPGLAGEAGRTAFTRLLQPDEDVRTRVTRDAREVLGAAGLNPAPESILRFYPAPPSPGADAARPAHRLLLVGLDGADWDIIDPLMEAGRMPNLKRLVDGGIRARLKTITPVLSPIIWTSIATGVGPARHGIIDFLATSSTTGRQIPVTSNMRKVKALWNIASDRGLTAGVVAWWASWPAEAIDGFIVSDRVSYQLFGFQSAGEELRGRTYPESLALAIQPLIVGPAAVTDAEVGRFIPEGASAPGYADQASRVRSVLASARTYSAIGLDVMRAYDPDLKMIYFEGTDTIAHNFMRYRPPLLPGVTPEEEAAYGGIVDRFYEYQDGILGRTLALADDDTVVLVCSDHGFRTGTNRPVTDPRIETGGAADWHRKFGILVINGPGIRRGVRLEDASVLDIAPTSLALLGLPVAQDMEGRVLAEAFEEAPGSDTIATYETGAPAGPSAPLESALDEEIVAKLTALGYVAQTGSNALNNTGITLMDRGRYAEAVETFRKALAQQPGFMAARINLGRALMQVKQYDEAIATFERALKDDPSQPSVHNLIGNILMDRGDLDGAERQFRRAIAIAPNDTNAHNSLGLLYERTGRDDEAIAEYSRVVGIDSDYAEGYNNIGLIHRKRGEGEKAIGLFRQAIQADPDFPGSYNNMGLTYQDMGRLDEARAAFEEGLEVDPNNAVILNNLGTLDLSQQRIEDARGRFQEAIDADPEYPSAHNNMGAVLGMMGRQDDSFEEYLKAVDLDPNYTDARFNLARVLLIQNKPREALDMLRKVLEIDPKYGKAHLQLGILMAQQGDLREAEKRADSAAREMPGSPDPLNLLAEIYLRTGRAADARRELQHSLELAPNQPRIREMLSKVP